MAKTKKPVKKAVASKRKAAAGSKSGQPAKGVAKKAAAKSTAKKSTAKKAVKKKTASAPKKAVKKAAAKPAAKKTVKKKAASAAKPVKNKVAAKTARTALKGTPPARSKPVNQNKKVKLSSIGGAVQVQQKIYAEGVDLLNSRKYSQAATRFNKVVEGPDAALRHSATVYLRICQQRMQSEPEPKTAEDRYNAAVACINDRRLEDAERLLRLALKQDPRGAHLHFALGVAATLSGDISGAISCIERAIELDPQSRNLAMRDSDLATLRSNPAAAALFATESTDEVV